MKYVLKQIDDYTPSEITVEFTADSLPTVLEQFHFFLKGCGFIYNGEIDIVEPQHEYFGFDDNEDISFFSEELKDEQHSEFYFDKDRNK